MPASLKVAGRSLLDHVRDALAGRHRRPEVAVQDVADVVDVLRDERLVEPERGLPLGHEARAARSGRAPPGPGSPGTRWIMKNVAVRSSASETRSRAVRRTGRPTVSGRPTSSVELRARREPPSPHFDFVSRKLVGCGPCKPIVKVTPLP